MVPVFLQPIWCQLNHLYRWNEKTIKIQNVQNILVNTLQEMFTKMSTFSKTFFLEYQYGSELQYWLFAYDPGKYNLQLRL